MGKDDDQDGAQDLGNELDRRRASLLLSGLVLTPDGSLDVFRERRAADATLDLELLRLARDILDEVSLAITSSEPERWARLQRAWDSLCDDAEAAPSASTGKRGATAERTIPSAVPEPAQQSAAEDDGGPTKPPLLGVVAPPPKGQEPHEATDAPKQPDGGDADESPPPAAPPPAPSPPAAAPRSPVPAAVPVSTAAPAAPVMVAAAAREDKADVSPWAAKESADAAKASPRRASASSAPAPPPAESSPPAIPPPKAPPAAPSKAPDDALPPAPAGATGDLANIDVEALNRIELDETKPATLVAAEPGAPRAALPFRKGAAKAPPPAATKRDDDASLGETVEIGQLSPLAKMTLPFQNPAPQPSADDGSTDEGSTEESTDGGGGAEPRQLPVVPEAPAHLRAMTLEQYAGLCAECAVHPSWTDPIHARYGVQSHAERAALDAHWRARLGADRQLMQLFRWHYARYEQWAKQQRQ